MWEDPNITRILQLKEVFKKRSKTTLFVYLPVFLIENQEENNLSEQFGSLSLGELNLETVSKTELIDSKKLRKNFLSTFKGDIEIDNNQMIVNLTEMDIKNISIPHSLVYWSIIKQNRNICLIKPNSRIICDAVQTKNNENIDNLKKIASLTHLMYKSLRLSLHIKEGCKNCNRDASSQSKVPPYHYIKSSGIGGEDFLAEEEYMAKRISDVVRLPGNQGLTHDIIIPKNLIRGLVQKLYKQNDSFQGHELSNMEYLKRFSEDSAIRQNSSNEKKNQKIQNLLIYENPSAIK